MSLLGGYASVQSTLPAGGYEQLEIDITPHLDGSPDGYFFANQFGFTDSVDGGYLGLQTVTTVGGVPGKAAIFSMWNATGASSSGDAVTFSGEGVGWSCRIAYNWVVNRSYRLMVQKTSSTTWSATVTDLVTTTSTTIGGITTSTDRGLLTNTPIAFHERYSGTSSGSASAMYDSAVTFSNVTGGVYAGSSTTGGATYVKNDYTDKVTDAGGYYGTRYGVDGVFSYIGYALGTGTVSNSFETSAASGTAVTTSNANFPDNPSAVNKAGDGAVNFSSSRVAHGTRALYTGATASGSYANAEWALNGDPHQHVRTVLNVSNNPSAAARIVTLRNSAGVCLDIEHTTGGLLRLRDSAGTVKWTSPSAISTSTWYRLELDAFCVEFGQAFIRVYSGADSTTLLFSGVVTGANFRSGPTTITLGSNASTQNEFVWWDSLKTDEATQPGPYLTPSNTAPVVTYSKEASVPYGSPVVIDFAVTDAESNNGTPVFTTVQKSDANMNVTLASSGTTVTATSDRPGHAVLACTISDSGSATGVAYVAVNFTKRTWQPLGS